MILFNFGVGASAHKHEVTYLAMAITLALTSLLTDIIKNAVGRPRPDLISRCKPGPDTQPNTLVTISVCTETDHHVLHDGWRYVLSYNVDAVESTYTDYGGIKGRSLPATPHSRLLVSGFLVYFSLGSFASSVIAKGGVIWVEHYFVLHR
jgi:hypothetical protein